jgi:hypothetical protein
MLDDTDIFFALATECLPPSSSRRLHRTIALKFGAGWATNTVGWHEAGLHLPGYLSAHHDLCKSFYSKSDCAHIKSTEIINIAGPHERVSRKDDMLQDRGGAMSARMKSWEGLLAVAL